MIKIIVECDRCGDTHPQEEIFSYSGEGTTLDLCTLCWGEFTVFMSLRGKTWPIINNAVLKNDKNIQQLRKKV